MHSLNIDNSHMRSLFFQDDFSVDTFLKMHSDTQSLEGLRDNLSKHLKLLESEIIDIVNSESSTILRLCSSLNGLDVKIDGLATGIKDIKGEIVEIVRFIEAHIERVNGLIELRNQTRAEKDNLKNVLQVLLCCKRLSKILDVDGTEKLIPRDKLLRSVDMLYLINYHFEQCQNNSFTKVELREIHSVQNVVLRYFENAFLDAIKQKDVGAVKCCLEIGTSLNREREMEKIIRKKIIEWKLNDLLNEKSLNARGSLDQLYSDVVEYVKVNFHVLLEANKNNKNYNFFINSIWSAIDSTLRVNFTIIYAPGDADIFHRRFHDTMSFIMLLNSIFSDQTNSIFAHETYKQQLLCWNLPVYFQIRFKEIAGELETVLGDDSKVDDAGSGLKLKQTNATWTAINRCLDGDVFVKQIADQFWKLILQIIARYELWVVGLLERIVMSKQKKSGLISDEEDLNRFETQLNILVHLYNDLSIFSNKLMNLPLNQLVVDVRDLARSTLQHNRDKLVTYQPKIQENICDQVCRRSILALKKVSDIPRLYRKTNKSMPTKHADYVDELLMPSKYFHDKYSQAFVDKPVWSVMIQTIHSTIVNEYFKIVKEILTQLKNTEDSLKRLKKDKSDQRTLNDDPKIRTQLYLDVTYYCSTITKVCPQINTHAIQTLVKDINK